jgi:LysM repeat protein
MRTSFSIFIFAVLAGILSNTMCYAQSSTQQDITDYILTYKAAAIEEMQRAKIPASITLAQGLHESGNGKSVLAREAKNHFGIKCHKEWTGKTYTYDDDAKGECFRVYDDAFTSYRDHSDFLTSRPRYSELFQFPINDYKSWAYGLKAAGYATNPKYAEIIIRTIEENKLYDFDNIVAPDNGINNIAQKQPVPATKQETPERQPTTTINQVMTTKLNADATVAQVASLYGIEASEIVKYNDIASTDIFPMGSTIFLEHKRKTGEVPSYTVKKGDSMKFISDQYGVRLNTLYARNLMKGNDQPIEGETIYLQGKRTDPPSTVSYADFIKQQAPKTVIIPNTPAKAALVATNAASNSTVNEKITEAMVVKQEEKIYIPITSKVVVEQTIAKQPIPAATTSNMPTRANSPKNTTSTYIIQPKDTLYSLSRKFNVTVEEIKTWNNMTDNSLNIGQSIIVSK